MSAFQPWNESHFKADEETRYERKSVGKAIREKAWRDVCAMVDARDKKRCRACGRKCDPVATALLDRAERHHILYRSAGGPDESWNVVTICKGCHNDEHRHRLRIEGNADEGLTFYRSLRADEWYISRQEIAPHQLVARD